jgi:AraC-like DNA-binding protein
MVMSPNDWISISIPNELASTISKHLSCDSNAPEVERLDHASPISRDLWGLIHRYLVLASQHPQLLQEKLSVESFQNSVLSSISALLKHESENQFESRGRKSVIDRNTVLTVVDKINAHLHTTLSIRQLANEMGISERTLRNGFAKYYGMSPTRYIQLQRLHRARKQLKYYGREGSTVSKIAGQLGMWDFGRFAARYKALFGELPSETLVRSENRV